MRLLSIQTQAAASLEAPSEVTVSPTQTEQRMPPVQGIPEVAEPQSRLRALSTQIRALGADQAQRLIYGVERSVASKIDRKLAKRLRESKEGEVLMVPLHLVVPGQAQLSFDHAKAKIAQYIETLDKASLKALKEAAPKDGLAELPVTIGPKGKLIMANDRHHALAGIKLLIALVETMSQAKVPKSQPELSALMKVLGSEPQVKVVVKHNRSAMGDEAFNDWAEQSLYAVNIDGRVQANFPRRFGALSDNPYRELASRTRAKLKPKASGLLRAKVQAPEHVLWLKEPDAPDYIEFHVASVFRRAFERAQRSYNPSTPLQDSDIKLLHRALRKAVAQGEPPELANLPLLPLEDDFEDFRAEGERFLQLAQRTEGSAIAKFSALDPKTVERPLWFRAEDAPKDVLYRVAKVLRDAESEEDAALKLALERADIPGVLAVPPEVTTEALKLAARTRVLSTTPGKKSSPKLHHTGEVEVEALWVRGDHTASGALFDVAKVFARVLDGRSIDSLDRELRAELRPALVEAGLKGVVVVPERIRFAKLGEHLKVKKDRVMPKSKLLKKLDEELLKAPRDRA